MQMLPPCRLYVLYIGKFKLLLPVINITTGLNRTPVRENCIQKHVFNSFTLATQMPLCSSTLYLYIYYR